MSLDDEYNDNFEEEEELAEPVSTTARLVELLKYCLSFLLAPLLFAGFTALFVLPHVVAVTHQPVLLWTTALIIIALAVTQAIATYRADGNNALWAIYTVGGFFAFLLVGCFVFFALWQSILLLVMLTAASIILTRLYLHPVPEGYVDMVYAFQKYQRTLSPGFNIVLPWEKVPYHLKVAEVQWTSPMQHIPMSRNEDVQLKAMISYQLVPQDAHLTLSQASNWEENLQNLFIALLQNIATTFSADDFLSWPRGRYSAIDTQIPLDEGTARWERVNDDLLQKIQDRVALWGVQVNWVYIRDITLAPHAIDTTPPATTPPPEEHDAPTIQDTLSPHTEPVPNKIPKTETLVKAYQQVQGGNITDPETIRKLAKTFHAVANDPVASQSVEFDAERAARNLYEQAKKCEEQLNTATPFSDERGVKGV